MRTKLLLLFLLTFSLGYAQMTTSTSGDVVTFTFDDSTPGDDWDVNGNPINLYVFVLPADAGNGMGEELAGGWPGTAMTNVGGSIYELSVDLSNAYPPGTSIADISYIYNNSPMTDQNPSGFGNQFSAVDRAGFTPLTTLSDENFGLNSEAFRAYVNNRTLNINSPVGLTSLNLYSILGQRVLTRNYNGISNVQLDLNAQPKGIYVLKVGTEQQQKTLKIVLN